VDRQRPAGDRLRPAGRLRDHLRRRDRRDDLAARTGLASCRCRRVAGGARDAGSRRRPRRRTGPRPRRSRTPVPGDTGPVNALRDYEKWLDGYADPESSLPWRLRTVQGWITDELDARSGRVSVVSVCAGDGRDLIDVLAGRADRSRVK